MTGCWDRREACPQLWCRGDRQGWQLRFGGCGHHNSSGLFAVTVEAGWDMPSVTGLVYISDTDKGGKGPVVLTFT